MAPSAGAIIYKAFHRVCPPPCPGEHVRSLITSPTYGCLNDRAHIHTYNTPRSPCLPRLVCSRPRPLFFIPLFRPEKKRDEVSRTEIPWIEGREPSERGPPMSEAARRNADSPNTTALPLEPREKHTWSFSPTTSPPLPPPSRPYRGKKDLPNEPIMIIDN